MAGFHFHQQFYNFEGNIDSSIRTQDVANNGYHQPYSNYNWESAPRNFYQPRYGASTRSDSKTIRPMQLQGKREKIRYKRPKKFDQSDQIKAYTINNTLECLILGKIVLTRERSLKSRFLEKDTAGQEDIQCISKLLLEEEINDDDNTGLEGDGVKCFILNSLVDILIVPSNQIVFERNKRTNGLFTLSKRTMKDIVDLKLKECPMIFVEGKRETSLITEDGTLIRQCRVIILNNEKDEEHFYQALNWKRDYSVQEKQDDEETTNELTETRVDDDLTKKTNDRLRLKIDREIKNDKQENGHLKQKHVEVQETQDNADEVNDKPDDIELKDTKANTNIVQDKPDDIELKAAQESANIVQDKPDDIELKAAQESANIVQDKPDDIELKEVQESAKILQDKPDDIELKEAQERAKKVQDKPDDIELKEVQESANIVQDKPDDIEPQEVQESAKIVQDKPDDIKLKEVQESAKILQDKPDDIELKEVQESAKILQDKPDDIELKEVQESANIVQDKPDDIELKEVQESANIVQDKPDDIELKEVQKSANIVQDKPDEIELKDTKNNTKIVQYKQDDIELKEVQESAKILQDKPDDIELKEVQQSAKILQDKPDDTKNNAKIVQDKPDDTKNNAKIVQDKPDDTKNNAKIVQDKPDDIELKDTKHNAKIVQDKPDGIELKVTKDNAELQKTSNDDRLKGKQNNVELKEKRDNCDVETDGQDLKLDTAYLSTDLDKKQNNLATSGKYEMSQGERLYQQTIDNLNREMQHDQAQIKNYSKPKKLKDNETDFYKILGFSGWLVYGTMDETKTENLHSNVFSDKESDDTYIRDTKTDTPEFQKVEQKKKRNAVRRFLSRTRKSVRRIFICGRMED